MMPSVRLEPRDIIVRSIGITRVSGFSRGARLGDTSIHVLAPVERFPSSSKKPG